MTDPENQPFDYGDFDRLQRGQRSRKLSIWGWVLGMTLSLAVVTAVVLPAPYVIERPGTAYNVLGNVDGQPTIEVSGTKTYPTDGALELMTIEIYGSPRATPTWMELLFAWLDPAQLVIPLEAEFPKGTDTQQQNEDAQLMFVGSEVDSEAAALKALGYQLTPILQIQAIKNGAPADKKLQTADEPVSVNGVKIEQVDQFVEAVKNSGGKPLTIVVNRKGVATTVEVTPVKTDGVYRIGIVVGTGFDFPIDTKVNIGDVGGPSGGLILALGIYDKLTEGSLTAGNIIAGTGTVNPDGEVGPIGGVISKLYLAKSTGAKYFLIPADNCADAIGHVPAGLNLLKVTSLSDGIRAVKAVAAGNAESWPGCSTNAASNH